MSSIPLANRAVVCAGLGEVGAMPTCANIRAFGEAVKARRRQEAAEMQLDARATRWYVATGDLPREGHPPAPILPGAGV